MTPLTVAEARALLRADEMLRIEFETQLGVEERFAWKGLMESARDRLAAWNKHRRAP